MSPRRAVFTADSPTNPATPTAVRRIGLGDTGLTFSELIAQNSNASQAWGQIQGQLQAEMQGNLLSSSEYQNALSAAQGQFINSYNQLNALNADANSIIGASQQYALQAQSVLGSVQNVAGFISAANSPYTPPQALVQSFTGIVVGIAIAAGTVSAGVGAAIVGGVALAVEAMSAAGFFPPPPSGSTIPGCDQSLRVTPGDPNTIVVGCVAGVYSNGETKIPGPQDPRWRHFPDPSTSWFVVVQQSSATLLPFAWGGGTWGSGTNGPRPVDAAWPQFRHLECEQGYYSQLVGGNATAADFLRAFFTAWKINQSLRLNGQSAADDASVLKQVVTQWNRAHSNSSSFTFQRRGGPTQYMPSPGPHNCADVLNYGPYVSYLVDLVGGTLTINTGAMKKAPNIATLTNNVGGSGATSTTRKLAAGLVWGSVIALGGTVAYSLATKTPVTAVWQRAFDDVAKFVKRPLRSIKL